MINRRVVENEEGSVLIVAIMVLALLTIIGIAVTTTTSIELQIAANDRIYKENSYQAEGAAMLAAQLLENAIKGDPDSMKDNPSQIPDPSGSGYKDIPIKGDSNDIDVSDILKDRYWKGSDDRSLPAPGISETDPPRLIVRYLGVEHGWSLAMDNPQKVHSYSIYGRQKRNNSTVAIELGYRNWI